MVCQGICHKVWGHKVRLDTPLSQKGCGLLAYYRYLHPSKGADILALGCQPI